MNLTDFIEGYKKQDESVIKDVIIRKYIPLREKFDIIKKNEDKIAKAELEDGLSTRKFVLSKEMIKFFCLLLSYTNIEVDEYSEQIYDECLSLNIDRFFTHYVKYDYERFCRIFDEMIQISDAYMLRSVLMDVGKQDIGGEFDKIIESIYKNSDVLSNLNEILRINNRGIRKETV